VSLAPVRRLAQSGRGRFRSIFAAATLVTLAPLGLSGAAPPDLSGTWVFDKAQSEVAPNASLPGQLLITQKNPNVKIEMIGGEGKPGVTLDFVTDGKPASNTLGVPQTSSARWDGDKLVIAWNQAAAPAPGPPRPRRASAPFNWTWKLGPGGRTLINEVEMNPGPNASGEKWVFVRTGK
jgi:hypothetical protein